MRLFLKFAAPFAVAFASGSALAAPDDRSQPPGTDGPSAALDESHQPEIAPKQQSDDSTGKDPKTKGKNKEKPQKGKISLPLVEHYPSKGLKIPYYDGQGKLQMIFFIGIASRLDADHVEMSEMRVQSFDENGDPDLDMDVPASVFDLDAHILRSHTRTTVKRQDFEISGDNVEFNTDTKESNLTGNVRMLIYNLNDTVNSKTDDTQASAKAPK
jgi:hypothetical protein